MLREIMVCVLIGICSVLVVFLFITDSLTKKRKRILFAIVFASMLLVLSEELAYLYDGIPGKAAFFITRISKFFNYGLNLSIIYAFAQYLKDMLRNEGKLEEMPKNFKLTEQILLVGEVLVIFSQFTKFYYFYDANNVYHRSNFYGISYIFSSVTILILTANVIRFRKIFSKKLFLPFLMFTLAPLVASIAHFFIRGIPLIGATIVAMAVLLYCFSILDANEAVRNAHQKEMDLLLEKQKHTDLMVEQTTLALAETIDAKDKYTNGHSKRVAEYSVMIAEVAGKTHEECKKIYLAALLHDVGKIGIPDAIINKEGKLTDEEYAIVKTHPQVGRDILSKISISPDLAVGASFHHERYDGKGYPFGLKGEEIPETARIIAVADTFDAMTSKRSYRDGLPKGKVVKELVNGMGTQFDPKFAKIMVEISSTLFERALV